MILQIRYGVELSPVNFIPAPRVVVVVVVVRTTISVEIGIKERKIPADGSGRQRPFKDYLYYYTLCVSGRHGSDLYDHSPHC